MAKIRCSNYHAVAIRECGLWDIHPDKWDLEQRRAVSKRQHEMREELGLPHPDPAKATLRPAWSSAK